MSMSHSYIPPFGWMDGGATTYPPSARMSTPSSELTEQSNGSSVRKYRCSPPRGVLTHALSGNSPFAASKLRTVRMPSSPRASS